MTAQRRSGEPRLEPTNYGPDLASIAPPEPWTVDARCAETDPEAWFPDKGGSTREAKRVCSTCLVATECLDYALQHNERFGIWGGLTERERRKITSQPKEPNRTSPLQHPEEEATA